METNALQHYASLQRLLEGRGYVPHEKQRLLLLDNYRYKVIRCGRRFGKTVFAVNKIIQSAALERGDYWFVAPTYRQAESIAWRQLLAYLPTELIAKKNETKLEIQLTNGSFIALKGADNPDSLRGVGLNGVVMDECAFIDPYAWTVLSPILQDRKGWAIFISTPNGYNWFYNLSLKENEDKDFKSYHFTSYDNPYLDPEELDKEKARMSPERFEQEYMAEFTKRSGVIWPFSRDVHAVERRQPDTNADIYGSIDFGYAIGHPAAILWHEVKGERAFTFDGFLESQMDITKISEQMRRQTNNLYITAIYCDSARPDLIEALKQEGWPVLPAKKDVEVGLAEVGKYMQVDPLTGQPRWTISKHLEEAIRQIEGYSWQELRATDEEGNVTYKQIPVKKDDDAPDSLRYFLASFIGEQEEIQLPEHSPVFGKTGY